MPLPAPGFPNINILKNFPSVEPLPPLPFSAVVSRAFLRENGSAFWDVDELPKDLWNTPCTCLRPCRPVVPWRSRAGEKADESEEVVLARRTAMPRTRAARKRRQGRCEGELPMGRYMRVSNFAPMYYSPKLGSNFVIVPPKGTSARFEECVVRRSATSVSSCDWQGKGTWTNTWDYCRRDELRALQSGRVIRSDGKEHRKYGAKAKQWCEKWRYPWRVPFAPCHELERRISTARPRCRARV